jgi:hypothetical protein
VRASWSIATIFHTTLWAMVCATLLFRTAPDLYRDVRVSKIGPLDPNRSIEPYFRGLTGIANGPQHLGDVLEYLPRGKPLVIFVRADTGQTRSERNEDSQSEFLGMLVGYICWPRDVRIIHVSESAIEKEIAAITPDSIAGMAFCGLPAPSRLGKAIHLGTGMSLVPAKMSP